MKYAHFLLATMLVIVGLFTSVVAPHVASAHVGYVVNHADFVSHEGADWDFLIDGVKDAPLATATAVGVGILVIVLIVMIRRTKKYAVFFETVRTKLMSYHEMLGWMTRLAMGIALIGAGTANVFISPVLAGTPQIGLLEIFLGFLFLLGFLITPAIIVTIGLFLVGLSQSTYLLGNCDFIALALALLFLDTKRPGLDDLLNIGTSKLAQFRKYVPLILRIGLGIAFIFLAMYEKFLNPHDSELVVTTYHLTKVIPVSPALWVLGAGMVEFVLGILLIIGFEIRVVAIIAFLVISLSFFYFKESVYSHVTLFGALSMLVVTGAGKYSVDSLRGKVKQV